MAWQLPNDERTHLRELARRQAELAALPVMARRKRMWQDLNDGRPGARPPVAVDSWTFNRDFMPKGVLHAGSELGRNLEWGLLRNIRNHELIDDDKAVPDTFDIGWFTDIDHFGVKIERTAIPDSQGYDTAYEFKHPITDLARGLKEMLRPAVCRVDTPGTLAYRDFLSDLLGEFLPVRITSGTFGSSYLTQNVIQLMGMEAFFLAMYDTPDLVHRLMGYLRDNCLAVMTWAQREGLLRVNNGNDDIFGGSYAFSSVPAPGGSGPGAASDSPGATGPGMSSGPAGPAARLEDMWSASNSQETVGISASMFHEFCFPYYRDVCQPIGRLYFGCCEPAHTFWDDLRVLPHLRKVSVNRWTDERFIGEALRGSGIVFSRKPDPNLLGVNPQLDEGAWSAHIRATLEATRGVLTEFIIRDVYTLHGEVGKARRAVALARAEIDRYYPG